ncbi:hypothetical protein [Streptomyces tirandamycinicus]|uniref:Uncharacterized protein n=1 Tax=Streptomyces tirandamycinicus TaxID=2174846 RepID=A0A2S1T245_9ACTN|nr:hypothetical protein [Streptomyces tirandamycinicus]AWI32732.1 hypothetical protein DDW44_30940 [Streptomyces tirandamycinicus]
MVSGELMKLTFAIDVKHVARLTAIKKKHRRGMAEYTADLVARGMPRPDAQLEARRLRPERWPTLDTIVARAIEQRLEEDDLAGPWRPLTPAEEEGATLMGRGPGKNYPGFLKYRAYELPSDLVKRLRTASIRVSEGPLDKLDALGLTYNRLDLSPEEKDQREELIEKVYSVPRIARQALERYGPWPREERPPSAPPAEDF